MSVISTKGVYKTNDRLSWGCLGIKFADLARSFHDPTVTYNQVATGEYIEAAVSLTHYLAPLHFGSETIVKPAVILAVFIVLGSFFMLYVRARMGPGPYFTACLFGCICLGELYDNGYSHYL